MDSEVYSNLLDSDASAEAISREMSAGLLEYASAEADALGTAKRAKVLIALLHTSDERLADVNKEAMAFCEACEKDDDDWIRAVANIVLRWLKKVPKDRDDFFSQCERRIMDVIKSAEPPAAPESYTLPVDVVPTHWPFLAKSALPKGFDMEQCAANPHFSKEQPVLQPTITLESVLPPKIREAIEKDSSLLTEEHKKVLLRFFTKSENLTKDVLIPIHETTSIDPTTGNPRTVILQVKLTPAPSWKFVKVIRPPRPTG